jgi:hypothetical protein
MALELICSLIWWGHVSPALAPAFSTAPLAGTAFTSCKGLCGLASALLGEGREVTEAPCRDGRMQ